MTQTNFKIDLWWTYFYLINEVWKGNEYPKFYLSYLLYPNSQIFHPDDDLLMEWYNRRLTATAAAIYPNPPVLLLTQIKCPINKIYVPSLHIKENFLVFTIHHHHTPHHCHWNLIRHISLASYLDSNACSWWFQLQKQLLIYKC